MPVLANVLMAARDDVKSQFSPPLWATMITVVRAAILEEVFYRGYAIDHLQRLGAPD